MRLLKLKEYYGNLSLTSRFMVASVVVVFFLLFIINIMIYKDFKDFIIENERKNFEERFRLSLMSKTSLHVFKNRWTGGMDFSSLLNILKNEPYILEVVVYSPDKLRLDSMVSKEILVSEKTSKGLDVAIKGEIYYELERVEHVESYKELVKKGESVRFVQEVYYPVVFNEELKGILEIYKDSTEMVRDINHVRIRATLLLLLGFVVYVVVIYLIVKRIDEREKRLREKLADLEKISMLGQFASKMAHELGTPIHVILGNADILSEVTDDEFVLERADNISRQVHKMNTIIKNYLYASKRPEPSISKFNLRGLVTQIRDDLSFTISDNIQVESEVDDVEINSDKGFIEQVLFNFVKNSADSIGADYGKITINSEVVGNSVILKVTDSGKGVPKEIVNKIFDPFFSTKKTGKGTGLGLAVCKELVESLGGEIFCESVPGKTVFGIKIPVDSSDA